MSVNTVAIHALTAFPPSNPNRDETGQPKTAQVGGKTRQRISSQAIKRAWRLSKPLQELEASHSVRTRQLGTALLKIIKEAGASDSDADKRAKRVAGAFDNKRDGKTKKLRKNLNHDEMVVYGNEEWQAAHALAKKLGERDPEESELEELPQPTTSIDCALFGRMRAANPALNCDASVAVSHPLSVNQANIESDFWTSVDDLSQNDEGAQGAGGMGDVEFGSAVYYTYLEISVPSLIENLGKNKKLAVGAVLALIKAVATCVPSGYKNTFGNSVRASYLRAECGETSGNLFCAAFEKPVIGTSEAIEELRAAAEKQVLAYGLHQEVAELSLLEGKGKTGSLPDVIKTVETAIEGA